MWVPLKTENQTLFDVCVAGVVVVVHGGPGVKNNAVVAHLIKKTASFFMRSGGILWKGEERLYNVNNATHYSTEHSAICILIGALIVVRCGDVLNIWIALYCVIYESYIPIPQSRISGCICRASLCVSPYFALYCVNADNLNLKLSGTSTITSRGTYELCVPFRNMPRAWMNAKNMSRFKKWRK